MGWEEKYDLIKGTRIFKEVVTQMFEDEHDRVKVIVSIILTDPELKIFNYFANKHEENNARP